MADAVRGPNQATSVAARVEAEAHAAVAAVQAGVDARRAKALAAVQAESEAAGLHRLKCCTGKGRCLASLIG